MVHGVARRWVRSLLVGGICVAAITARAAIDASDAFGRLSVEEGLSQASVSCILQDRHGFLWFGTQFGLNRYDGYSLRVFNQKAHDPGSLADNWVTAMFEDTRGRLWVGTRDGGLNRYDDASERFTAFRHHPGTPGGLSDNIVLAIWGDMKGTLWVGTMNGLNQVRDDAIAVLRIPAEAPPAQRINALLGDTENLWIGTGAGLFHRNAGTSHIQPLLLPGTPEVNALARSPSGALWVGTTHGLFRFEAGSRVGEAADLAIRSELGDRDIRSLYVDRTGVLWIGSFAGGLARYDTVAGTIRRYRHDPANPHSLGDSRVSSLFQDRSGTLWVGTWHGGANHMDLESSRFAHFGTRHGIAGGLTDKRVLAIAGDGSTVLWIGTANGLNRLDLASGQVDNFPATGSSQTGLSHGHVLAVAVDADGTVWAGTKDGLNRLDPGSGRFTVFRHDAAKAGSLNDSYVSAILPAADGVLWLGTWDGGLNRFDPVTGTAQSFAYPVAAASRSERINAVYRDSDDTLWLATAGDGLVHFDPANGQFRTYPAEQGDAGPPHGRVHSVLRDSRGWLWVGTAGGLARSRTPAGEYQLSFQTYTSRDGLAAEAIGGVLEDRAGRLWISTVQGISRFDPDSGQFTNYGTKDGALASGYYIKSHYQTRDGRMFFGGSEGMSIFHPDQITANPHPPKPILTALLIGNRPQEPRGDATESPLREPIYQTTALNLPYQQAAVTLEFSALHFADASRNRYAYRLDGYDSDWVATDARNRRATYTNLDPGRYRFRIKASNKDGVWGTREAQLDITILPPFWMTGWFRLATALALVGVGYLGYRWRVEALHRAQRHLETEVAARTEELRALTRQLGEANARLEETSLTDPLTGLKNRRFLLGHLDQDLALAVRQYADAEKPLHQAPDHADLVFFLIDCDHFKSVNDSYGHKAGDRLLAMLAELLRQLFRESDYLVRWGGEEFLVVARFVDRTHAPVVAERLRALVANHPFRISPEHTIHKTCSIGYAVYPFLPGQPDAVSWTRIVAIADLALYCAKRSGRNAWVGINGTERTRPRRLVTRLSQSTEAQLAAGEVTVASCLPADALRWTVEA
ncbi:ligand-binding sensor domain-containing diguanylate cyclase [Tahibacter amnicola]|uniref:Diguanylate cyclase n=1 Tax=Tahibacter amnicola TaxID=2976241 RepID=A0ABY6BR06_9GAMM|nr:ligand-binding sensor domain-containing diguanylate cyclase [Tahibacter amnicola]UXI70197.1 diguanylate cyclase [Tahibacter amnicola]